MTRDPDKTIGTNKSGMRAAALVPAYLKTTTTGRLHITEALVYAAELFICTYAAGQAVGTIDPDMLAIAYDTTLKAYRAAKGNP